jgi:hypothetical protein
LKSLSVSQIFFAETEPRHELATARRMLMPLQKRHVLLLKSSGPMMFVPDFGCNKWIEWLQSSRWDEAIFLMIPGTSCLATIVLSLRDKNHPPIEAPRIILALMGVTP